MTRRRFECVVCREDLGGSDTRERILHIRTCRASAARPLSGAAAAAVTPPPLPMVFQHADAPLQQPPSEQLKTRAADGGAGSMDALARLMQSARTKWAAAPAAVQAAAAAPVSRDAFAHMMHAAAATTRPSSATAAASSGRAGGGHGAPSVARAGGRGGGGHGGGRGGGRSWGGSSRPLASFKTIEDTSIVVDGFTRTAEPGRTYFLTHFHSDHYVGLTKQWSAPIYCSEITATLVARQIRLAPALLRPLPMDRPVDLPSGVRVTLIDANHCPGAVLLLFELPGGTRRTVLHTGDFRYDRAMAAHPAIRSLPQRDRQIDLLYLDTTYCEPRYTFPPQREVLGGVLEACRLLLDSPRTLVLFGAYSIGKERVYLHVARSLGVRLYVDASKRRVLDCLRLPPEDCAALTGDAAETRWRVVPMATLRLDRLRATLQQSGGRYDSLVAFRPTGWSYGRGAPRRHGTITVHEAAYSEHSSFEELRACVRELLPAAGARIIPTVNCGRADKVRAMLALLLDGAPAAPGGSGSG